MLNFFRRFKKEEPSFKLPRECQSVIDSTPAVIKKTVVKKQVKKRCLSYKEIDRLSINQSKIVATLLMLKATSGLPTPFTVKTLYPMADSFGMSHAKLAEEMIRLQRKGFVKKIGQDLIESRYVNLYLLD